MDDEVRGAGAIAAHQLVGEGSDRLLAQLAGPVSEVDEVAGVDAGLETGLVGVLAEERGVVRRDLLRAPHPARLGEDLHGFCAVRQRAREGFVQSAGGGFVVAEEHEARYAPLATRLRYISFQPRAKNL